MNEIVYYLCKELGWTPSEAMKLIGEEKEIDLNGQGLYRYEKTIKSRLVDKGEYQFEPWD